MKLSLVIMKESRQAKLSGWTTKLWPRVLSAKLSFPFSFVDIIAERVVVYFAIVVLDNVQWSMVECNVFVIIVTSKGKKRGLNIRLSNSKIMKSLVGQIHAY